ncbi:MAG: bifunctional pyr operon transcriptional regulator/uracil phosphoribosyltransferase PyrR [Thermoanaerobaculia bacterium]
MPHSSESNKVVLDGVRMRRVIRRMAGEIVERSPGLDELMLIGIRTRGVPLAEALAAEIEQMEGQKVPLGILDITLYRDDLSTIAPNPVVKESVLPGTIENQTLILCDDVLYTGRTIRSALDALIDYGRPRAVQLAVLIDRGHRELPIQADVVGRTVATEVDEIVAVHFHEIDGSDEVLLSRPDGGGE